MGTIEGTQQYIFDLSNAINVTKLENPPDDVGRRNECPSM
jgi:hypothetical protein